jgi:hypothetical protein
MDIKHIRNVLRDSSQIYKNYVQRSKFEEYRIFKCMKYAFMYKTIYLHFFVHRILSLMIFSNQEDSLPQIVSICIYILICTYEYISI